MSLRNINSTLKQALLENDEFIVAHLIKFEKPKLGGGLSTATDGFVYLTDAPFPLVLDGITYNPGRVKSIGGVKEGIEAKASNMSLKLAASSLGTTTSETVSFTGSAITFTKNVLTTGFRVGDVLNFTHTSGGNGLHDGLKFKVESITGANQNTIKGTILSSTSLQTDSGTYSVDSDNLELNSLLLDITGNNPTYIHREVLILRAYINPKNGKYIGNPTSVTTSGGNDLNNPFTLFKGNISKGILKENVNSEREIMWTLTDHWGDFVRINSRRTSDTEHRKLDSFGVTDQGSLIRPEYEFDYGFEHSEKAINAIGRYTRYEQRTVKVWSSNAVKKLFGGKKTKTVKVPIVEDVDLQFNLAAKDLPVVYGVQRVDPIPIFVDTNVDDGDTDIDESGYVYVANTLCEGEIGGIYDIHVDGQTVLCTNGTDVLDRDNKDDTSVLCFSNAEAGHVLGGFGTIASDANSLFDPATSLYFETELAQRAKSIFTGAPTLRHPKYDRSDLQDSMTNYRTERDSEEDVGSSLYGIANGQSIRLTQPSEVVIDLFTGIPNQRFSDRLVKESINSSFKLQKDFYDEDPHYWTPNHKLLDTAYVVNRFLLTAENVEIPRLTYVVKGKYVNCFNYDETYNMVGQATGVGDTPDLTNTDWYQRGKKVDIYTANGATKLNSTPYTISEHYAVPIRRTLNIALLTGNVTTTRLMFRESGLANDIGTNKKFTIRPASGETLPAGVSAAADMAKTLETYDARDETKNQALDPIIATVTGTTNKSVSGQNTNTITISYQYQDSVWAALDTESSDSVLLEFRNNTTGRYYNLSARVSSLPTNPSGTGTLSATLTIDRWPSFVTYNDIVLDIADGDTVQALFTDLKTTAASVDTSALTEVLLLISGDSIFNSQVKSKTITISATASKKVYRIEEGEIASSWAAQSLVGLKSPYGLDDRISINPAMQLLDYLTDKKYGKGLDLTTDINLESFKQAARDCDTRSDITIVVNSNHDTPTKGDVYKYEHSGYVHWMGEVLSHATHDLGSGRGSWKSITFTNCSGKLINKPRYDKDYKPGALLWKASNDPSGIPVDLYRLDASGADKPENSKTIAVNLTNVQIGSDRFVLAGHGYTTGQKLITSGTHSIAALTGTTTVHSSITRQNNENYVRVIDEDKFELYPTEYDAKNMASIIPRRNTILSDANAGGQLTFTRDNIRNNKADLRSALGFTSSAHSTKLTGNTPITLDKVSGSGTAQIQPYRATTQNTAAYLNAADNNPIIRSFTNLAEGFSSSGYSLYDCDDLEYYKLSGWDCPDQFNVTRHQTSMAIDTSKPLFDNVNTLLAQFNGILTYTNGKYSLKVKKALPESPDTIDIGNKTYTPAYIHQDDIIGDLTVEGKAVKDMYNSIQTKIIDPIQKFGTTEVTFFNSEYLNQDRAIPKSGNVSYPGITNYFNARINIKQRLDESRAGLTVSFKTRPQALLLECGDFIYLSHPSYKFSNKAFRITGLQLDSTGLVLVNAAEHNNAAYILKGTNSGIQVIAQNSESGRTAPVVPTSPVLATNEDGTLNLTTIVQAGVQKNIINWTHSAEYEPSTYLVEVWRHDANVFSAATKIATQGGTQFIDNHNNTANNITFYYWLRYIVQPKALNVGRVPKAAFSNVAGPITVTINPLNASNVSYTTGTEVTIESLRPNESGSDNTSTQVNTGVTVNQSNGGFTFNANGAILSQGRSSESAQNANEAGFWMGYNSTSTKYTMGVGDHQKFIKWDGTNLSVAGNITATSLSLDSSITVGKDNLPIDVYASSNSVQLNEDPYFTNASGDYWFATGSSPHTSTNLDSPAGHSYETNGTNLPTNRSTYFKLVDNDTTTDNFWNSQYFTINSGKTYKLTVWARQTAGDRKNYLLVDFRDDNNDRINNSSNPTAAAAGSTGWPSIGSYHYFGVANQVFPSTYTKYEVVFGENSSAVTAPTGAVKFSVGGLLARDGSTETTIEIAQFLVEEFDSTVINAALNSAGGWTIDDEAIFTGTKDFSEYNGGNNITLHKDGGIHAKNFYINGSDGSAHFRGLIEGGTIQGNNTNPMPTDIFTRSSNRSNPVGTENGGFIDLANGHFIFGKADKFIAFGPDSQGTTKVGIRGDVICDTLIATESITTPNLKVGNITANSVGVSELKEEVFSEIDQRLGNAGGYYDSYETGVGNTEVGYLGQTTFTKLLDGEGSSTAGYTHAGEKTFINFAMQDEFMAPQSMQTSAGDSVNDLKVKVTIQKAVAGTTSFSAIGASETFSLVETVLSHASRFTADFSMAREIPKDTSGHDVNTAYIYRALLEAVPQDATANPLVYKSMFNRYINADGSAGVGANDVNGTPIFFEIREGSVGSGAGNLSVTDQLFHTGDNDTNITFNDDQIVINAGSIPMITMTEDVTDSITLHEDTTISKDLTVNGTLTVEGTTTTLNTATLSVQDKNITLNHAAGSNTHAASDGAGITIQDAVGSGTPAIFQWNKTASRFDLTNGLHITKTDLGSDYSVSTYADVIIEDVDAHLEIVSDSSGTWGSSILLKEQNVVADDSDTIDVWAISRQTKRINDGSGANGKGDGSLRFNYGTANDHNTGSPKVTFTNTGRVGIGDSTPDRKLHVETSDDIVARFKSTDNKAAFEVMDDDTTIYVSAEAGKAAIGRYSGIDAANLNIDATTGYLGIGTTSTTYPVTLVFNDDTPATTSRAMNIDVNLSDANPEVAFNNQDVTAIGLFVDVDSTVSSGDVDDEHRVYGVYADVDINSDGDSDLVYGVYGHSESNSTAGTCTALRGLVGSAVNDNSGTSRTTNTTAGLFTATHLSESTTASTQNYTGSQSTVRFSTNATADANNMYGAWNEVEIDPASGTAGKVDGALYATYSIFDNDDQDNDTIEVGNTYLFYGNYTGGVFGNQRAGTKSYGLYIPTDVPNYFAGNVGIGTNDPASKLTVVGDIEQTTGDLKYTGPINWDIAHHGAGQNIVFSTTPTGGSATQRMRIDSSGNVGIGTNDPKQKLQVDGNIYLGPNDSNGKIIHGGNATTVSSDGPLYFVMDSNDTTGPIDNSSDAAIIFGGGSQVDTNSTHNFTAAQYSGAGQIDYKPRNELMRITPAGNVGIGTNDPAAKLQVEDLGIETTSTSVSSTDATLVDTFAKATFRSARYTVQITQGSAYQCSDIMAIHDGTTAIGTEYAMIETGSILGTLDVAVNGDNVELKVTMAAATAATVKVIRHCVAV